MGPERLACTTGMGSDLSPARTIVRSARDFLTVADFNRDGHLDIVTNSTIGDVVSVVYGLGNNAFQDAVFYATGDAPFGVTHGDFHGDGILDLAVTSLGEDGITILRGIATGGFIAVLSYSTGMDPYDIKVGDFNEDGISDLVVTNSQSHDISILRGRGAGGVGNGTFDPEVALPPVCSPTASRSQTSTATGSPISRWRMVVRVGHVVQGWRFRWGR